MLNLPLTPSHYTSSQHHNPDDLDTGKALTTIIKISKPPKVDYEFFNCTKCIVSFTPPMMHDLHCIHNIAYNVFNIRVVRHSA